MKRLFILAIGLIAIVWAFAYAPAPIGHTVPDDEEDPRLLLLDEADRAINSGDYDAAAARLLEAVSLRPGAHDNVLLLSNLGMVYSYQGCDSLALATLDAALAMAPAMTTIQTNRARILLNMGRDAEAYQAYTKVLERDSLNVNARFYRGMMALYSGRLEVAETDFEVLRTVQPDNLETAKALAALYSLTGREMDAIPYFERLLAAEPVVEYYVGLISAQIASDKLSDASSNLATALEAFPDDPDLYYCRAWLHKKQYRIDDAKADLRKAVSLGLPQQKARQLMK